MYDHDLVLNVGSLVVYCVHCHEGRCYRVNNDDPKTILHDSLDHGANCPTIRRRRGLS